ncbi:MAG: hypothetical protein AAB416_04100 [Patescibacteria group bacterium]
MENGKTNGEPTISDVLEAINEFSTNVDKRFDTLETRVTTIEETMVTKDDLKMEFGKLRSDMIDYIADQNMNLRGDIIQVVRGEDKKVLSLIQLLISKSVITKQEAQVIVHMQPFPGAL